MGQAVLFSNERYHGVKFGPRQVSGLMMLNRSTMYYRAGEIRRARCSLIRAENTER
jgi:hypothetical protein